jgi:hypothetical protein
MRDLVVRIVAGIVVQDITILTNRISQMAGFFN